MRRTNRLFFVILWCAACSKGRAIVEPPAVSPDARSAEPHASALGELPALTPLARSAAPKEPVKILVPSNGAEIEPGRAGELPVRVVGATGGGNPTVSLELSLDGARPRPVAGATMKVADLLDPGVALAPGAHDLVLVAVGADGLALDPRAGGAASARFFVGPRPATEAPPRFVCLAPFGTVYGSAPRIALDFVVVPGGPSAKSGLSTPESGADVLVTIEGPGASRRMRATGPGPFLLGDFQSGEHRVTLTPAPGTLPMLPGVCVFAQNHELERSP